MNENIVKDGNMESFLARLSDNPGRILIADDDRTTCRLLQGMLQGEAYNIVVAGDGEEALTKATSDQFDVFLLDVMMPKLDGFTVCTRLREKEETALTPILLITSLVDRDFRIKGMKAGANDFLTKPIDPLDLILRVENALRFKRIIDRALEDHARLKDLKQI
jgi:PleD family two-component response regulator